MADPNKTVQVDGKAVNQGSFKSLISTCDFASDKPFATGSTPIILGDFEKGYQQIIAQTMFMLPDPYTEAGAACMRWHFHMYNDGMPVMPEAFVKLTIK